MRRLKFKLDRKSLEQIYLVFIRPLLEYGDIIWDNCLQSEKQELEKIQIEAARIATGATKLVSIAALYREIRWDSLDERRRKHKLTLFYKMTNALATLYLSSLVPQTVSNASRYNLRNSNDLLSKIRSLLKEYVRLSLMSLWQCRGCTTFLFSLWKLPASSNCTSGCCFPLPES